MGAPKLEESGKRIQGNNLLNNCKTRQKQMKYLLENMKEPNFDLIDAKPVDEDSDELNTAGITFRILNSQGFGNGAHLSNTPPSWGSVANFMASIQDYLPKSLRTRQNPHRLWSHYSFQQNGTQVIAEYTQELLNDMCAWLMTMKTKIEDYITSHYFSEGRINHLEILKRRFKDEWSERTEQNIDANVNNDTELNVIIEDA
jgi:hypothetical protein